MHLERPAHDTPVVFGTVLFANAPDGLPIKPEPVELIAHGVLGHRTGWATLDDALVAVAGLTAGAAGAAAVVRDGSRYVAHALQSSWFGRPDVSLSRPVRDFGGLPTVHPAVAAFVDGAWVERVGR